MLLRHLQLQFPLLNLRSHLSPDILDPRFTALHSRITVFDHVVVSQRHYLPSSHSPFPENSLIAVRTLGSITIGELMHILVVDQEELGRHILGHVRWLVPADVDVSSTPWANM